MHFYINRQKRKFTILQNLCTKFLTALPTETCQTTTALQQK